MREKQGYSQDQYWSTGTFPEAFKTTMFINDETL